MLDYLFDDLNNFNELIITDTKVTPLIKIKNKTVTLDNSNSPNGIEMIKMLFIYINP